VHGDPEVGQDLAQGVVLPTGFFDVYGMQETVGRIFKGTGEGRPRSFDQHFP
jgi:hypothetical protein